MVQQPAPRVLPSHLQMRSLVLTAISVAAFAPCLAQISEPQATGGTNASAPAALRPPAVSVGADSAASGTNPPASPGIPGGSPHSRVHLRGPHGTGAPATRAKVSVVGSDSSIDPHSALLPGMQIRNNALGIRQGTPIHVQLKQAVDSGSARNGQLLHGTLVEAVGGAPAGSPVELTVVAAAAAGQMRSAGEMSVQVIRINGVEVLSQVVTAEGQEGSRLSPDAAPARGTEAQLSPDKTLTLPAA